MTIRTRPVQAGIEIGPGETLLILKEDHLDLISALLCMVKMGHRQYQAAAGELLDAIELATGDADYGLNALMAVNPEFNVLDPNTLDVIATYNEDNIVEIVV